MGSSGCAAGTSGPTCTVCKQGWYGTGCRNSCPCPFTLCNPVTGCQNNTLLTTDGIYNASEAVNVIKSTIHETVTHKEASTKSLQITGTPPSSNDPPIITVIIVTGSVLCFFIIILIVIQLHGKLKKNQRHPLNAPNATEQDDNEQYQVINDVIFTSSTYNYDRIKEKSANENVKPEYNEIEETSSRPDVPLRPLGKMSNSNKDLKDISDSVEKVDLHTNVDYDYPDMEEIRKTEIHNKQCSQTGTQNNSYTEINDSVENNYMKEELYTYGHPDPCNVSKSRYDDNDITRSRLQSYMNPVNKKTGNIYIQVIDSEENKEETLNGKYNCERDCNDVPVPDDSRGHNQYKDYKGHSSKFDEAFKFAVDVYVTENGSSHNDDSYLTPVSKKGEKMNLLATESNMADQSESKREEVADIGHLLTDLGNKQFHSSVQRHQTLGYDDVLGIEKSNNADTENKYGTRDSTYLDVVPS